MRSQSEVAIKPTPKIRISGERIINNGKRGTYKNTPKPWPIYAILNYVYKNFEECFCMEK